MNDMGRIENKIDDIAKKQAELMRKIDWMKDVLVATSWHVEMTRLTVDPFGYTDEAMEEK